MTTADILKVAIANGGAPPPYFWAWIHEQTWKRFGETPELQADLQQLLLDDDIRMSNMIDEHFPDTHPPRAFFVLDECPATSYQPLYSHCARPWIPEEHNTTRFLSMLANNEIAVLCVSGTRGMGTNLQGLAEILRKSTAIILFVVTHADLTSNVVRYDAQQIVYGIDHYLSQRKLIDDAKQPENIRQAAREGLFTSVAIQELIEDLLLQNRQRLAISHAKIDVMLQGRHNERNRAGLQKSDVKLGPLKKLAVDSKIKCWDSDCRSVFVRTAYGLAEHWLREHTPEWSPTLCTACPDRQHPVMSRPVLRRHLVNLAEGNGFCPVSTCQKSFDKIPFWGYRALRVHMLKEHSAEETAENVALLEQIDSIAGDDDELLSEEDEEDEEDETGLVVEPIGGATL